MLNLRELERKLDEALEKETEESITAWVLEKELARAEVFLGKGTTEPIGRSTSIVFMKSITETEVGAWEFVAYRGNDLSMAA